MDVVVIAQYSGNGPQSNNRFREVCRNLVRAEVKVELITSTFLHSGKQQVKLISDASNSFQLTQIEEPGYRKNVSFRRIWSHHILAKNLKRYLYSREVPDVIYCAVPSLSLAQVALKYAERNGVKIIIDVQDLWPEAFELVLRPRFLAHVVFFPFRYQANKIYSGASEVVTVSDTYSRRVLTARQPGSVVTTVYLGTNLDQFDRYEEKPWGGDSTILHLVYIGTLGHSYDLPLVFDALRHLKQQGIKFNFHIMGNGPLEDQWKELARDLKEQVVFHGRLEYSEMVARLRACDVAINPIVPGAAQSIINKVCDYAAAGLPVVNTQDCEEYQKMLTEFEAGINCDPHPASVAEAIAKLQRNGSMRTEMGKGSRLIADSKFNRSITYHAITEKILNG